MKILFEGDSITDAGRDRSDPHGMGNGYPKYASELIRARAQVRAEANGRAFEEPEFWNFSISGSRSEHLLGRLENMIALQPDFISILIGVNDVWHRHSATNPVPTTDEQFEANYRRVLEAVKTRTHAKLLMLEPFLLDVPDKLRMRPELIRIIEINRALAREYADAYLPLDGLFTAAEIAAREKNVYSADGVHPNPTGAQFIAEHYLRAAAPLLETL